jgi:thymidylate kinase
MAAAAPPRVRVIDASGPVEAVSERLAAIIDPMIENYLSKRSQVTVK